MPISTMKKTTDERGDLWRDIFTALGLSTGAAVALGLSRFAYGLLLPPMQTDLQWTYVEAGALNTANGAGYIFGALVAAWLARRWGTARAFLAGFSVSVLVLLLTAMTASLSALILLRTVGSVSTAITFILGAGLVSAICPLENPRRRGALVGVYVAGGTMALLSTRECRRIAPTLIGYGVFGAGYVGYMTFIMALLREQGGSSEQMIWFWFTLGLVSAVTNLLWGRVLGAFSDGRGPALVSQRPCWAPCRCFSIRGRWRCCCRRSCSVAALWRAPPRLPSLPSVSCRPRPGPPPFHC